MSSQVETQVHKERSSPLKWLIPTQSLAVFAAWAVVAGEQVLRIFMLGAMALAMLVPLLISFEAGLTAMLVFEPLRGLIRRAQYIFVPYSETEPIHLITPFVTFCAFALVLMKHRIEIIRQTPLALWVTILCLICGLQIFNPLQGGLFIGFTGALYYLVPMAWFYFGQTTENDFAWRVLRLIVVLGVLCSLYGLYQTVFGYPWFEQYWIESTDLYKSINVYNVRRALATFSSAEEWGRYIQLGGIIAFGLGLGSDNKNKRILWFACAAGLCVMLVLTGQRSSIFGLLLGLMILILTGAKSFSGLFARLVLILAPIVLTVFIINPLGEDEAYDLDESDRIGTMVAHTAKGTVNPTGEGSLYARFETWGYVVTKILPYTPFGSGLGSTTLAASRANIKDPDVAIDNHFLSFAISAGIPAMLLLLAILIRAFVFCARVWRNFELEAGNAVFWRIMMALMSSFLLNNFFGTSFTIYSIAPIGWLLIGCISAEYGRLINEEEEEEAV